MAHSFFINMLTTLKGEELNKQFASALILFDCVYSCLYYMLSDEINMFKLLKDLSFVLFYYLI